jgi:Ribonuclease G/E
MAEGLIRVAAGPGEVRTALILEGALTEAWVEWPARPDGVGDVHLGRVTALAPALAGAFVTLAEGPAAFLPESEAAATRQPIARSVQEGQLLAVRVTRAAQGSKGPRVTARLGGQAPPAAGAPRLLARGPSAPERLARAHPTLPILAEPAALRARLPAALRSRIAGGGFDAETEEAFAALGDPIVPLPGGGRLTIQPTQALTAIDVDTGTDRDAAGTVNRRAIAEAARQIRLRNLGGAILLDLAGMAVKARAALEAPLAAALARDPGGARLLGLTRLGLFEIQRPRIHPPLHERLGTPLAHGLAALRRVVAEQQAMPGAGLVLRAAPEVLAALEALPGALAEAEAGLTRALGRVPDPRLRPGQEEVAAA